MEIHVIVIQIIMKLDKKTVTSVIKIVLIV